MTYEQQCMECNQVYDAGMFLHGRGICDYCWAIMGMDHVFYQEEIRTFGEIPGAANLDIDFGRGK